LLGRALGQKLSEAFGQPVVIDNRPGAGGSIGTAAAAKAPADGYTLLLSYVGTFAISPWLSKDVGYDPIKDFSHISLATTQPNVVVVNPRVPANNLKELAALAKSHPDRLTYAAPSGIGQMGGELFQILSHTKMVFIPYKGGGPAAIDLVGGHIDLMYAGPSAFMPMIKSGKLRAIAVAGPNRVPAIPDVLTAKESGFPDFEVNGWYGVAAPANTPRDVIAKLNAEIARALAAPDVKDRLVTAGLDVKSSSPDAMESFVRAEHARWGKVIRTNAIKAEFAQ
jgi:tripartite-type tricarboxylate transporter receptor subunit TctC